MSRTIEERIEIAAPAAIVWRLIADVGGWPGWNPLYPQAAGAARPGETLQLAIALPGLKPHPAAPVVTDATPERRFAYLTRPLGGLVQGNRYVEIETAGPSSCTVRNGETMGGLLGPLLALAMGAKMRQAFETMNAALKSKAEAG